MQPELFKLCSVAEISGHFTIAGKINSYKLKSSILPPFQMHQVLLSAGQSFPEAPPGWGHLLTSLLLCHQQCVTNVKHICRSIQLSNINRRD